MPPLYKRYIPPKPNAAPPPPAVASTLHSAPPPAINDEPKKRKRERTDDEVAERKAKKLRKKGIDPATAEQPPTTSLSKDAVQAAEKASKTNGVPSSLDNEPRSEFAHIKNTKKRHKLEKEARQARIAAEKADKEHSDQLPSITKDGTEPATSAAERQPETSNPPDEVQDQVLQDLPLVGKKQKGKRRKTEDTDSTAGAEETAEPSSANGTVQRPKTDRKDKKQRHKNSHDIEESEEPPAEESVAAASHTIDTTSRPKKRRHKLESVLQESNEEMLNDKAEEDAHLKKHGGILKKYQKSAELSQSAPRPTPKEKDPSEPEPVLLDLAPLPQPEPAQLEKFVPDDSALPAWLAKPTIVSSDATASFSSLKLHPKTVDHMSKLGFRDVLPVQQALIPLLLPPGSDGAQFLPGTESVLPDVAVGAPTGSGKTIAYLLPIIESLKISNYSGEGRLRALVVVPTRELVMQVAAVAESLAKGSTIKIGMATGSGAFKDEQAKLIKRNRQYDPKAYSDLIAKADRRNNPPAQDSEEFEQFLDELEEEDMKMEQRIMDTVRGFVDHVPTYKYAVDVLVATPGRLLDHLKSTLGFSLAHLEFLVFDEADKLLDLQYDGLLETVNAELERPRNEEEQDARERFLRGKDLWDERKERRVRKVVLSATMTRDISKLVALKLKRPQMIVVRGSEQQLEAALDGDGNAHVTRVSKDGDAFELPTTLREYCTPVGDGSEKPLFLTELLRTRILETSPSAIQRPINSNNGANDTEDSENSTSDSDSSSDSSSSTSDSASTSDSDSDSSSAELETRSPSPTQQPQPETSMHPSRTAMLSNLSTSISTPTILIFTSSTESAARLSHFLKALQPAWSNWIHTMTRTDSKPKLSRASPKEPVIVVSTDRAGRGLDALSDRQITHVIQYDVPRSLTAYVHRVGRTARAGRGGEAWTLYAHSEARWFFKSVAGAGVKGVKRAEAVEKVKVDIEDDDGVLRERLREVVEGVRGEVFGGGKKR